MLDQKTIKALLEIDTQNVKDTRCLRILSCDNPIKDLYIYHLSDIREEFAKDNKTSILALDENLALCIFKFNIEMAHMLNDEPVDTCIELKNSTIKLVKPLIQSAMQEVFQFYDLVLNVATDDDYNYTTLKAIETFKVENYIAILELCGLVNISEDLYRSKFLSRFLNIKEQVKNYLEGRMKRDIFRSEFSEHLKYLRSQLNIIKEYNMTNEDFLVYTIMFDIRHYKHNRKNRVFRKDYPHN